MTRAARTAAGAVVASAFWVGLGLVLACGSEDLVVVRIEAGPPPCLVSAETNGGSPDAGPADAAAFAPCADGFYCAANSCTDVVGTCQPRPATCNDPDALVCGCDGVTYLNDCLAQRAGANVNFRGAQCPPTQRPCGPALSPCPTGTVCTELLAFDLTAFAPLQTLCPLDPSGKVGSCWGLPTTCSASSAAVFHPLCDTSGACVSACKAVQSGSGFYDLAGMCAH